MTMKFMAYSCRGGRVSTLTRGRWHVAAVPRRTVGLRAGTALVDGLSALGLDEELMEKNVTYLRDGCVVAKGGIKKGDTILSVPERVWVTRGVVEKESGLMESYSGVKDLDTWIVLALFLLYEQVTKETMWAGYVGGLMDDVSVDVPILWKDDDVAMLQGTQIADSVVSYKNFFVQTYQNLVAEGVLDENFPGDEDGFVKAACIVRGCSHAPLTGEQLALVPGIEGLQYKKIGANSVLDLQSGLFGGQKSLAVKAIGNVEEGEAITFDVAPECTQGHVLLNHGMIDTNAPGTFAITLVLPEDDTFYDDKIDILELNGLQSSAEFILQTGAPPPETMLAMLRLINLDNADAFLLESIFRNEVWGHVNLPVSEENERAVYESMASGCASVLQSYPNKLEEDIALLKSLPEDAVHARMAVALRLGEKEVLEATLRFFEDRLGLLKDLEYYGERRLKRLGLLDKEGKPTDWDSFFDDGIA